MKIKLETIHGWLFCKNEHAAKYSIYKLHAFLPISNFDAYHSEIYRLLVKAVEDGIIPEFKILNRGGSDEIGNINATIEENPAARLLNSPFTIYLFEGFDAHHIVELCQRIEMKLSGVPCCNREFLSVADLPLTDHITFRQETLDGQYVKIAGAAPEALEQLKQQGESSNEYLSLKAQHDSFLDGEKEFVSKMNPDKEKEDFIRGFYNAHFTYYQEKLSSKIIHEQFQGACTLLGINYQDLLKLTKKEDWDKIIDHRYRIESKRFHPDRIRNATFDDTVQRSREIFNLVKTSQVILKNIAENPNVLDEKKILEQEEYRPAHQYELKEGFHPDPYYYIHMAKDASEYVLIKNWDFQIVAETIGAENKENGQREVVLYKPELCLYRGDNRKTIALPGYEAFYYLFLAGALPNRFDSGHFDMIFGYGKAEFNQTGARWLMAKVLTTPEFVVFMYKGELVDWAIKATQKGIVNIGRDRNEVFLYYYQHDPEIVYFSPKRDLSASAEKLTHYIVKNQENLNKLKGGVLTTLVRFDERLKKIILNNKLLMLELSSEFLENEMLAPYVEKIKSSIKAPLLDGLLQTVIEQMLRGNMDFLPALSNNKLKELKQLVEEDMPLWMPEVIDEEFYRRSNKVDMSRDVAEDKIRRPYLHISPKEYIKNKFLNNDCSVVNGLNKDTLVWLAAEPEVHWSSYLPIIKALIELNETKTAGRYACSLASGLGKTIDGEDMEDMGGFLSNVDQDHLANINAQWRKERIEQLKNHYDRLCQGEQNVCVETHSEIENILANIGDENSLRSIDQKHKKALKETFFNLVDRLKSGEKSEALLNLFRELQLKVKVANLDWKNFSEKDRNGKWLVGGQVFTLMYSVIGVRDSNASLFYKCSKKLSFGIDPKREDLLQALRGVFFLYECISTPRNFYKTLRKFCSIKTKNHSYPDIFDERFIIECLLKFADNEFAVYIDGEREGADYKSHRFYDSQNIRKFDELYSLYHRLGQEAHFCNFLPNAFQKLLEAEQKYRSDYLKAYLDQGKKYISLPLLKYTEMREHLDEVCPQFENMLLQDRIHQMVTSQFSTLQSQFFSFTNNRAVTLCENVVAAYKTPSDYSVIKELSAKTLQMLAYLRDFLYYYSDTPLYNDLLNQLVSDPILKDYLELIGINLTEKNKKKIANAISAAISRKGLLLPGEKPLMLMGASPHHNNNKNKEKEKEKEKTEVTKNEEKGKEKENAKQDKDNKNDGRLFSFTRVAIFDWDGTLAEEGTTDLYPGAETLLKELLQKKIKVCILTGRPGKDPTSEIFTALTEIGISLDREAIMWAGAEQYQGDGLTSEIKANAIEQYQQLHNLPAEEILFIDDRKEYVQAVECKGFKTILVPTECFSCHIPSANNSRLQFFQEVKNQIFKISLAVMSNSEEKQLEKRGKDKIKSILIQAFFTQVKAGQIDKDLIEIITEASLIGIQCYLNRSGSHLSWKVRFFDGDRGKMRAAFYSFLLEKNSDALCRLAILYAMLVSDDGNTLQKDVTRQFQDILGDNFTSKHLKDFISGMIGSMVEENKLDQVNAMVHEVVTAANDRVLPEAFILSHKESFLFARK